jgi:2-iminobutanoate/2-iminopropanoate deaminase
MGPYNQAVLKDTLYASGQITINPATGELVLDTIKETKQVMHKMKAVLDEAGMTFENIVKTIYS